jgi:hypothetical protein
MACLGSLECQGRDPEKRLPCIPRTPFPSLVFAPSMDMLPLGLVCAKVGITSECVQTFEAVGIKSFGDLTVSFSSGALKFLIEDEFPEDWEKLEKKLRSSAVVLSAAEDDLKPSATVDDLKGKPTTQKRKHAPAAPVPSKGVILTKISSSVAPKPSKLSRASAGRLSSFESQLLEVFKILVPKEPSKCRMLVVELVPNFDNVSVPADVSDLVSLKQNQRLFSNVPMGTKVSVLQASFRFLASLNICFNRKKQFNF